MKYSFTNVTSPAAYRVFQRNSKDVADIEVAGEFKGGKDAVIEFRIGDSDWQQAKIKGNSFSGVAKSVPVCGPYTLELKISGEGGSSVKKIPGLLVGDLWVLGGQSNMDGYGKLANLEIPSNKVNCFYYNEEWGIAEDPLCILCDSIDQCHCDLDPVEKAKQQKWWHNYQTCGAGLGVSFGKNLYKATGVPVGLIMCSHGGTSMAQWNPDLKSEGGKSMYGSMFRRVGICGWKIAGVLWYQGESDTGEETTRRVYTDAMIKLIEGFRADIGTKDMPFIYVQLGPFFADDAATRDGWNNIQTQQLKLESKVKNIAVIPAIDAGISDCIHLDAQSLRKIGKLMALQARKIKFGEKNILSGPRPVRFEGKDDRITVTFDGVNGTLQPSGKIRGFSVEAGDEQIGVKCTRIAANKVELRIEKPVRKGAVLWYGRGVNPVCTLTDSLGFPCPVFGPIPL